MILLLHISSHFLVHRVLTLFSYLPQDLSWHLTLTLRMLKQKVVCKLYRNEVISLKPVCLIGGRRRHLIVKRKKKGHFALQNNCWKLYRDWKLNAFVDCLMICCRKQCFGEYGLKRHYPFLLVNLIVSVEWIKVGSE